MASYNNLLKQDMDLLSKIAQYTSPENIPISFVYREKKHYGIPKNYKTSVKREFIDSNITKTTISGKNDDGLIIIAEYIEYRDFPVTEWVAYFKNTSDKNSEIISDIKIIDYNFKGNNPVLCHGNGDTCNPLGYEFWDENIKGNEITIHPLDGTPCNGASPFMKITFDDWCFRIGIGWPALWEVSVSAENDGVRYKLGQKRCNMYLLPDECIRTPRVNFMCYTGGEDHGRNLWRKWYLAHILPREHGIPLPPKLCLHTYLADNKPEFTGATEENQISGIDNYINAGYKPDIWWIDAGWYPCDFDWPHTGTWIHNEKHFPNGLDPVGQKCDDNDIQLLLWFEPERVRIGTEIDLKYPDWCLKKGEEDKGDRLLNLGNPDCCEWLIDHIDNLIKRYHVRIYRQDFNFNPLDIWEYNEESCRIGAIENAHVSGYLHYWDELLFRNPNLWIDSCASGGRRNEMETLRRAVPLHYTDVGYGEHPIKQKQHRFHFEWVPYFRAHTMNWDNENGDYINGGKPVDLFAYHNALTPAVTSMIEHNAVSEQFDLAKRFDPIWRKAAEIMLSGDYYPLTECKKDPADWYAFQFNDSQKKIGFIQIIRNTKTETNIFKTKIFIGEEAEKFEFENMETGIILNYNSYGLRDGFEVSIPPRSGVVWFYKY